MFRLPMTAVPDIQPHTIGYVLAGPSVDEPTCYYVSVTPAGVFFNSPLGRGGHYNRFDYMRMLLDQLHMAVSGNLASINPLMGWFNAGHEHRGDDTSVFSIFQGVAYAYCDWHTQRKRAYARLSADIEAIMQWHSNNTASDRDAMEAWEQQYLLVEDLAIREGSYCDSLKSLCHADRMYGGKTSMVAAYEELIAHEALILTRYE